MATEIKESDKGGGRESRRYVALCYVCSAPVVPITLVRDEDGERYFVYASEAWKVANAHAKAQKHVDVEEVPVRLRLRVSTEVERL